MASTRKNTTVAIAALLGMMASSTATVAPLNSIPRFDPQVDVVLLDPNGSTPLGGNAKLPPETGAKKRLRKCLRSVAAAANYPAYDGPPVVVEFSFELDPGSA